ncbi:MAG TPA: hypothetical protein VFF28_05820 [Candidatus Nanoarchaeia archaeon]|nr:hypothetical protein [Candidatus Nanoarchaeia archaeon]
MLGVVENHKARKGGGFFFTFFGIFLFTMPKKCIICGECAEFNIKGSSECYCKGCASDSFEDLGYLEEL